LIHQRVADLGSRVFLLELIVVVIIVIFLLFFFNRVFGFVVSYIIRTVTWHRYKAHVHVEAIQLSFLAGRILFKNFRYQSRNQSIYVLKGHVTWGYWLRRVRVRENSQVKDTMNPKLPCRVSLALEGVEWFIYNRTPAYDAIVAAAEEKNNPREPAESGTFGRSNTFRTSVDAASGEDASDTSLKQKASAFSNSKRQVIEEETDSAPFLLHLLPIQITCKKGAISLGNTATPSIVVAQFAQANVSVDAAESRSKFDLYKMVYDCQFIRPTVQIKMNIDYKEPLLTRATRVVEKTTVKDAR